ncbi:IS21 family transposase [Methanoculleus sp. Afa-1]|jgi:transposase|uniref:IS21 family transposase n=1 Tax=Methanoculleus formosensis TaxID=2590886 RepID=A0A9E5DF79_9EURY|nr:IS21 family transposase [Methanoculleus sp. Afa-1]MCT8338414.1 IS21 family transposase [Methanoculleus sp. Afa-1]
MFTVEEFFVIRDLHHQGLNISQISRKTGYHRNTVRKYLAAQTVPTSAPRRTRLSKLDPFKEYIQQRICEYSLSAARICREIQDMGFDGKCTIVKDYIRTIRPQAPVQAVLRYETKPGVQAQVDWGECGRIEEDGRVRKVYCFSMILGYSRMRYMVFTLSTDVSALIQCHLHAFDYFGGYTEEILYDNIKTVILKRALRASDHQWNPKFEDFFRYHGFVPRLCRPYCPQTKGKVENSIGYVKRDFLLGGTFSSLDDMNRQLLQWLNRVNATPHGTTNEIPFERLRQENLKPITAIPAYRLRREEYRKISREAYISYLGNRYSVPYRYAGREAVLELHDDQMTIRVGTEAICLHIVVPGHARVIREKKHFSGLLGEAMRCNSQSRAASRPLFTMAPPQVEHRPLSVYDTFADEVRS